MRGEEPVFVVTGRREDVKRAEEEIRKQSDHFSEIRANRHLERSQSSSHEHTRRVQVPYKLVGLVVGPKGATIKKIQEETGAYIITPNRHAEPVFEVRGKPEEVDTAARKILQHIQDRTSMTLGNRPLYGPAGPYPGATMAEQQGGVGGQQQQQQQGCFGSQYNTAPLTNSFRFNSNSQQNNGFGGHQNGYSSGQNNGYPTGQSNGYPTGQSNGLGGPQQNGLGGHYQNGFSGQQQNGFGNDHSSNGHQNGFGQQQQQQQNGYGNGHGAFHNGFSSNGMGSGGFSNGGGLTNGFGLGGQDCFFPAAGAGLETRRSSGSMVEEDRVFNSVSSHLDWSNVAAVSAPRGASSAASSGSAFGTTGSGSMFGSVLGGGASAGCFGAFGGLPLEATAAQFPQLGGVPGGSDSGPAFGPSGLSTTTTSFPTTTGSNPLLESLVASMSVSQPVSMAVNVPSFPPRPSTPSTVPDDPLGSVAADISRNLLGDEEEEQEEKEDEKLKKNGNHKPAE